MEKIELQAEVRGGRGKGDSRRARAEGKIPAVCYGKDQNSMSLLLSPKDLGKVMGGAYGKNAIVSLKVEGSADLEVMLKDFQRHPVTREILHVDFYVLDPARKVELEVPIRLVGTARGVKAGGRLTQVRRSVRIRCLPKNIPQTLEFDVTPMQLGSRALVNEIPTPEGVELIYDHAFAIAQITLPRGTTAVAEEGA